MRELWSKVPLPAVLVLDDYHDLPMEAGLHDVLSVVLAEFPPGATLIAISRNDPPSQLLAQAADVFGGTKAPSETPDLKTFHAKIGQLALENDFLEGRTRNRDRLDIH